MQTGIRAYYLLYALFFDVSFLYRFYSVLFRKLYDFDIIHTTKHSMFLNLLFRALKRDESLPRLRCFVKRILQVCLSSPPQLTCGLLYLVSELLKGRPEIRSLIPENVVSTVTLDDDDDEEEHYKDVDEGDEDSSKKEKKGDSEQASSTWVHRNNVQTKSKARTGYDPLARNPLYGRAEQSGGYWEMNLLAAHYHPSVSANVFWYDCMTLITICLSQVALFAQTVIEGKPIEYTGDPLQDFTLIRFLDRFVFRNPKKIQIIGPAQRYSCFIFCTVLSFKPFLLFPGEYWANGITINLVVLGLWLSTAKSSLINRNVLFLPTKCSFTSK